MKVLVEKAVAKYLERLNEPMKSRILEALQGLKNEPPTGDIKATSGNLQGLYRLRVGGYRVLFAIRDNTIFVTSIAPRGQAYK